jgi:LuxR family transcriptional regulator, maltose regulon positive regulatory protein
MHPIDGGFRFVPPTPRRTLVARERLVASLRERFSRRIVVVVAPAGFGKTTLLSQAIADNAGSTGAFDVWFSCASDDDAASTLSEGLCRAAGVEPQPTPEAAVDALAESIWHRAPAQVAIVLDDVHLIAPGSPGADVIASVVAALPRNGHLVLAGRTPPPVPLARLEVAGEVVRLGEADLSFSSAELADFASQRGVPYEQVTACGGWPALAELSASGAPSTDAAYLWEEVLDRLPADRRRDLALIAHAEITSEAIAAAVLGHDVDPAELTEGLPLATTSGDGRLHIHPLWLPHLARLVSPDEIDEARRRAALAIAARGDLWTAVGLLARAEAWDDMARVVIEALGVSNPPVPGGVAATWLGRLPAGFADGPLAQLLSAVALGHRDPTTATAQLQEAAHTFRQAGDMAGELAAIAQLGQVAWWQNDAEPLVAVALRFLEMEATGYHEAVPLACLARALVADLANQQAATLAELDRIPDGSLNETWMGLVDGIRAAALSQLGRPREAMQRAEAALRVAEPLYQPLVEASWYGALWMTGAVDEALDGLPRLIEHAAAQGISEYTAVMAATHAMLAAVAGRIDEADRYLRRARSLADLPRSPLPDVNISQAEAVLHVARGNEKAAAAALTSYQERFPVGVGLGASAQQRALALWYVLVPGTRAHWDGTELGPYFTEARALARAIVALRAGDTGPLRAAALVEPEVVRAFLPLPWATELALAQVPSDDRRGWVLLESLWPQGQSHVRRWADEPGSRYERPARIALARLPVPPAGRLELALLGSIELRRDGRPVDAPEWRRRRVRDLLSHLVLRRPDTREQAAADLWPELDAEGQARNLRVTLTHLLRALEPERRGRDASFLVQTHGDALLLHRGEWFDTDLWRFDELAQAALDADRRGEPSAALGPMVEAVALWRSEPIDLAGAEWALPDVEARRAKLGALATRAGELLLAHGDADRAREMGEVALGVDAWSDRAHHLVVRAHATVGHRRAAHEAVAGYGTALREIGLRDDEVRRRLADLEAAVGALAP